MFPQMALVIRDHFLQRIDPLAGSVAPEPAVFQTIGIGIPDDMRQENIIGPKQIQHLPPAQQIPLFHGQPFFIFVARKMQFRGELQPDDSLVVVGGRIDQMSDDFRKRPSGFGRPCGGQIVR
jgi:hypothetical protein